MLTRTHGTGNNNSFHKLAILAEKGPARFYLFSHQKKPIIYGFIVLLRG